MHDLERRPFWRVQGDYVYTTRELQHRTRAGLAYPVLSPNGSQVIVQGHEQGLTVVWQGGRPFRAAAGPSGGGPDDSVMIVDDEDEFLRHSGGCQTFVDDAPEFDPSRPYAPIVSIKEIALDSAVLQVAHVSLLHKDAATTKSPRVPQLLQDKAVIVVSCADQSVRIVTFGIQPTSGTAPDFDVRIISAPGSPHRDTIHQIAITFTTSDPDVSPDLESNMHQDTTDTLSRSRDAFSFKIIVASASSTSTPTLAISEVMLHDGRTLGNPVTQTHHLQSSLTSLAFNTSRFPSPRHLWLLAADRQGAVHVGKLSPVPRPGGSSRSVRHALRWQAAFHVPFVETTQHNPSALAVQPRRLRILDAQWAIRGKCVVVLLEDGAWGLWDVDRAGPHALHSHASAIPGSGTTPFALRGKLRPLADGRGAFSSATAADRLEPQVARSDQKLEPMTPKTRKVRQSNLFDRPNIQPRNNSAVSLDGGIAASGDSLLVHYDSAVYLEDDLAAYWKRTASRSDLSGGPQTLLGPNIAQLDGLAAGGQAVKQLCHLPTGSHEPRAGEVMICCDHRIVTRTHFAAEAGGLSPSSEATEQYHAGGPLRAPQAHLLDEDLDLFGIDQALDKMQGSSGGAFGGNASAVPLFGGGSGTQKPLRRVEFAAAR